MLTTLSLYFCKKLKLPSSIQMESLRNLEISKSPKVDTFPEINGDMDSLTKLTLDSTGIRELPSSIRNLSGLNFLYLGGCEDLVSLPNSLCNLMNLQYLVLDSCKKLDKLPEIIGDLQELRELYASDTAISQPPPSITKLDKLMTLYFLHEQQVQHSSSFILHQVSGLSSLGCLDLRNHNILGGLPEDLGSLTSLWYLNVSGSNISYLPKSINKLSRLYHLDVGFCQNLNELPGELPPHLVMLNADYHLALKSIRDLLIKCVVFRKISISWCGHEKSECGTVPNCQVNVLKLLQHFLRTCIQCDFHRRDYFLISFPEFQNSRFVRLSVYKSKRDLN